MQRHKYFLIAASVAISIGMHASEESNGFVPKRRKTGDCDSKSLMVLPRTPERPIAGMAYASHTMRQTRIYAPERARKDAEAAALLRNNLNEYDNSRCIACWGNKEVQLKNIELALHLVFEFLRPAALSQKNHHYVPAGGDPLLPDSSLFE